jgi:hypothetical protein
VSGSKPKHAITAPGRAIDTVLDVPTRGIAEGFSLAFSNGTLVQGACIPGGNACLFGIAS